MKLEELIDFGQAERLLDQHDVYVWKGCRCVRLTQYSGWYVYYHGKEIECWRDPVAEPQPRPNLAAALDAAYMFNLALEEGDIVV